MFLKHSFLQSQVLVSARAKGAGKLSVIIGTNKPFENYQQYFDKMVNIVMEDVNIAVPWEQNMNQKCYISKTNCWQQVLFVCL